MSVFENSYARHYINAVLLFIVCFVFLKCLVKMWNASFLLKVCIVYWLPFQCSIGCIVSTAIW